MERLLEAGKLSLVIDLDQTVLHATVDPSVHEWLHDPNNPLHQYTQVSEFVKMSHLLIDSLGYSQGRITRFSPHLLHQIATRFKSLLPTTFEAFRITRVHNGIPQLRPRRS